jgi:hypothetical protein
MHLSFAYTNPTTWSLLETVAIRGFHFCGEMDAKKKSGLAPAG